MERLPEPELTPEEQLVAMRDFIDMTSAAMATQFRYLQLMRNHLKFFDTKRVARAEQAFQATVSQNVDSLNHFSATVSPLQIVHEKLGEPARFGQFMGYDWNSESYGVDILHPRHGPGIWTLESSADIQLAPPDAEMPRLH
jgi:hypothetical protein